MGFILSQGIWSWKEVHIQALGFLLLDLKFPGDLD